MQRLQVSFQQFYSALIFSIGFVSLSLLGQSAIAQSDIQNGERLYQQRCAVCHNNPAQTRAPSLEAVMGISAQSLRYTLTAGIMQEQAATLSGEELNDVVAFLTKDQQDNGDWVAGMMCKPEQRSVDLSATATVPRVGIDYRSTRYLSADTLGIDSADLNNLELAWAIGFPKTNGLRSSPVIIGSTLFFTAPQTEKLLAMDTQTGCVKWVFEADGPLRTSISYGELGDSGKKVLVFASRSTVHAINPADGTLYWKNDPRHSLRVGITGSPIVYKDKIIVPISGSGVGAGANPKFECCAEHGDVLAMRLSDGKLLWTYHTMPDATYTGKVDRAGNKLRGPSGAPIWSTPTIDEKRGLVYATTGQNTSLPATNTSDAVLAIDIDTGELKWSFQGLANDVWHLGCNIPWETSSPSCPTPQDSVLKDYDFGAAAILVTMKNGKDILLAGQKSGDVWALDPDDNGKLIWRNTFGEGTSLGGVHWGMATDGETLYVPINDPSRPNRPKFTPEPGMNAVDIASGKIVWRTPVQADCSPERIAQFDQCAEKYGLSAIALAVDKSVIAGSIDGRLYVFDGKTGKVTWQFDTLRDFNTINGIKANGGAIDSHSITAGDGMIFVGSGYGSFRQPPGNVLLAFRPKAK